MVTIVGFALAICLPMIAIELLPLLHLRFELGKQS